MQRLHSACGHPFSRSAFTTRRSSGWEMQVAGKSALRNSRLQASLRVAARPNLRAAAARTRVMAAAAAPKFDVAVKGVDGQLGDCPFCQRALLTLEEKGVPYTTTLIDFDAKPQWLLDVNPAGSVPVMKELDSGKWVVDSGVIVDYLEARVPQPALGTVESSPQIGMDVLPKFRDFIKSSPEEAAAKEADLVACLQGLDDYLQKNGGPFIGGQQPNATDMAVWPRLYHMQVTTKHFRNWTMPSELSAVQKCIDAFQARDSWKHTAYPPELVIKGWEKHGVKKAV